MKAKKSKKSTAKRYPKALVEGAIAGNKDDFAKLLECCLKDITYLAMLYVDRQDAEDITQEVAIMLQRKIHTVTDPDHFFRWLSVVVRNTSISYMRKHHRSKDDVELEDYMDRNEYADLFTTERVEFLPERYVEDAELCAIVMDEIEQLPKSQRICLSYQYLYDFKRVDIVQATGYSKAQVTNALYKGKQVLKKRLERRLGDSLVFSVVPIGALPTLTRAFKMMQDTMVSRERLEQLYLTCLEQCSMVEMMPTKGVSNVMKYCIGATCTAVAVGVLAVVIISGSETVPMEEIPAPPPIVGSQEQERAPMEVDQPEVEESLQEWREIRTVADMIGEAEADILESFVRDVYNPEEWRAFVERIGAQEHNRSEGYQEVYITYILEEQDKRLLLAEQDLGQGSIRVLYLFGDRDEPVEAMTRIILRFQ